ncbi:hypothetical protein F2Q69_00052509 [Brassica cretica]|uniref:Uncharacterized protein n=1 Tax=Brassica cretica TaxID=69181 RepID=A0A8S9MYX4_BRACR|nr:hypothetical protein F2Q69_00052509 [Brassica cretica]
MSTRSNKGIGLLLVEPLDLERVIHKSKGVVDTLQAAIGSAEIQALINTFHPASIDIVHPMSIDTVQPTSIDTIQLVSDNTVHNGIIHSSIVNRDRHCSSRHPSSRHCSSEHCSFGTVHPDTVHPVKNNTTCREIEKIEVLILKVDKNGMLRDEEGRTRNSA